MELGELKRLREVEERRELAAIIEPVGSEYEIAVDALAGMKKVRIKEREFTLPGLERHTSLIIKTLAEFKKKQVKNFMPLAFAKSDDIVIMALRPQHFGLQMFARDVSIAAGKYTAEDHIIPSATGVFTVPKDQVFIITDFVDFVAESPVQAIQVRDIDGVPQYPFDVRKDLKLSDLRIIELDFPLISDATLDIDALVWSKTAGATVAHELTPFGVWIGFGKDVPKLRTET